MSNKLPVSYDRNLAKLVDICIKTWVSEDVRRKIPQIIDWKEKLPEWLSAKVIFEINWMKRKVNELWIHIEDFEDDFEVLFSKTLPKDMWFIPEHWVGLPDLEKRYHLLLEVIESNPEWWNKYRTKIDLYSWQIYFIDLWISLDLYDEKEKGSLKNFLDSELLWAVPTIAELSWIWRFITSAWEENISKLREFLWLKSEKYLSSSKWWYLLKWFSYFFDFETWNQSYSKDTDEYNVRFIER